MVCLLLSPPRGEESTFIVLSPTALAFAQFGSDQDSTVQWKRTATFSYCLLGKLETEEFAVHGGAAGHGGAAVADSRGLQRDC